MKLTMNTDGIDIERHVIGIQVEGTTPAKRIGVFHNHTRETVHEATEIAEEIVRRVNNYEPLRDALYDCVTELEAELQNDPQASLIRQAVKKANKVLRQAERKGD